MAPGSGKRARADTPGSSGSTSTTVALPSPPGVPVLLPAGALEELSCGICLGMLCRPSTLYCGHSFCSACIYDHERLTPAVELACPTCRSPLAVEPPALAVSLNAFLDKLRPSLPRSVTDESLGDWRARQRAWDKRAVEARRQWASSAHRRDRDDDDDEVAPGRLYFAVRPATPLERLMSVYCIRFEIPQGEIEFLFRGCALARDDNAASLGMQDGHTIDAVLAGSDALRAPRGANGAWPEARRRRLTRGDRSSLRSITVSVDMHQDVLSRYPNARQQPPNHVVDHVNQLQQHWAGLGQAGLPH